MDSLKIAKEILARSLFVPEARISDDAAIGDIKVLDSLAFEALVLELEERTGKQVDPVDLIEMKSVRDLAGIVKRLQ